MNRLQLARALRQYAGIAAGSTGNAPSSTLNQTGEYKRVVDWVDEAWAQLQREHKWNFQWENATVTVLAANSSVVGTIPSHRYVQDSAYIGSKRLLYLPWESFRRRYPAALISSGEPSAWSIRPDKAFVVDHAPTADTAISVERYKNPIAMAADTDEPEMPSEHHMAIVYKALLLYANFEEAGITRATAEAELNRHLMALGLLEMPDFELGEPLC